MIGVEINKIEYYLPRKVLNNEDITTNLPGWSTEKIRNKIGISTRHIASETETAIDLANQACIKMANHVNFDEIECLIVCTQSPDYLLPTSACILQNRIGLKSNTMCFDFNLGCSGYIYGLSIASSLIQSQVVNNCLFVTADTYSKYIQEGDGSNKAIFGDAATVTYLTSSRKSQISKFVFGTDGSGADNLIVKGGGIKGITLGFDKPQLFMNGPSIFEFTNEMVPKLVYNTLVKNELELDEIDYFVFHQANKYILEHLRKKLNIPSNKFLINMEYFGNTVSSSIPIVLASILNRDVDFFKNKIIMLVGFGVGYSWGAVIIKF